MLLLAKIALVGATAIGAPLESTTDSSRCGAPSTYRDRALATVLRIATGSSPDDIEKRAFFNLPLVDSSGVQLVTDEQTCDPVAKAALAHTPSGTPDVGIPVIRVGPTRFVAVEWRIRSQGHVILPVYDATTYALVGVIRM